MNLHQKQIAICLYFLMYVVSGVQHLLNRRKKVENLKKKIKSNFDINLLLPDSLYVICIVLTTILEIVGSSLIVLNYLHFIKLPSTVVRIIIQLFLLFLILVSIFIHHPFQPKKIPFFSNISFFGSLLYIYGDIEEYEKKYPH